MTPAGALVGKVSGKKAIPCWHDETNSNVPTWPNALVPILTVIGPTLASLLSGAVLTETACALPGLGRVVFLSISQRDHPVIIGGCLFFAFVFVTVNLAVDVLYAWLDPRIRHHE